MIIAQFLVSCQYHEAIYQDIYADIYQDMETTIQQPNLYVITFALNAYSIYIYKRIPIYLFYLCLLEFLCKKYGATIKKETLDDGLEIIYVLEMSSRKYLIKTYDAGSLTNMPKTSKWFEEECAKKHLKRALWTMFLCYDTDAYKYEVSPYYEGDWKDLRDKIGKVKEIIDLAAAADIEDVLLVDFEGVCKYIGVEKLDRGILKGRKGSSKMKALFRAYGKTYHKGERAQSLIEGLDLQKIIDSNILPLKQIEAIFQEEM